MSNTGSGHDETKRDFLMVATAAVGAVGAGLTVWPFINSLNPSADVLALASIEVDLAAIEEGQSVTVTWRGKPVFIRRQTAEEIQQAEAVDIETLPDPESYGDRVEKPGWLVMVGICTHLGCVPGGQKVTDKKGDFGGWYCPCHGSHYDTAGRIRKGPAPKNLEVPHYNFLSDNLIKIG
ncbi:ubiquinol-cytochrome c reductase iron-sulfur subunit [Alphaproteobacteria bacterium]|nr:ubiquinol-cytochrome c reductase iron-sulfur subunit [Alphaproteobacteria bacterium]